MGATEEIARFIVKKGFKDIPPEAVKMAKRGILDSLGVALAGSTSPQGKIIIQHVKENGGTPESTVLAGGFRTSAPNAALANGTLTHALDFDDTWLPLGHPTCTIFPVVLALGEKLKCSGRALLEAFILGMEIHGKVGLGYSTAPFHSTPIYGTLGAASAAAKILRLTVEQTRMALGIAASGAGGLACNVGTMTKPLHAGNAARNGLVAALLAKEGFSANRNAIEARRGYAQAFMGDQYDPVEAVASLGNPFHIVSPGAGIKTYPSCYLNHRPLAALFQIIGEHHVSYEEVESVEVQVPNEHFLNNPAPETGLEAKFSLQYNLAAALLDGQIVIDTFQEERVKDPRMSEAMKKVRLEVHPEIPVNYAQCFHPLTVRLKDGRTFTSRVDAPKGHWENPLSQDELLAKYRANAHLVLPAREAERSIEFIENMEKLENIEELMALSERKTEAGRCFFFS